MSIENPIMPGSKRMQVLIASQEQGDLNYLAFPALRQLDADRVLVACKRGISHARDPGAEIVALAIDTGANAAISPQVVAKEPGIIEQMGEWVRFPNGDIAIYIDTQVTGQAGRHYRAGMRENRSVDGGRTFTGIRPTPPVDGIEYGYPFDFIVEGNATYMLVMTFANLAGGRQSVDVIRSDDNGCSWQFVRNLTEELGGHVINESAMLRHRDGFLVTTRGYDGHERLYRTDGEFRMQAEVDLTATHRCIEREIGRPRLFARDGNVYLLGRNTRTTVEGSLMELALFRVDPNTLALERWVILDNAERLAVTDGYYAMPYFTQDDDSTRLHIITYKGVDGAPPDIVHLDYWWDEVR